LPFSFVPGDLCDIGAVNGLFAATKFDQVIHLAARAGVRPSLEQPALYQRVNVEGTVNILEAARNTGCRKITIASSSSVYGVNAKVPFSESDPVFSAVSPDAASKLACEALGHVYHQHLRSRCGDAAVFHGVWPAPATGSGHPQIHQVDRRRSADSGFWRRQHGAGPHVHHGHSGRHPRLHAAGIRF
jgi:nucleoside-diphosphate-sugar epimerase